MKCPACWESWSCFFTTALQHPIVSVKDVRELIHRSNPAANSLVTKFVTSGVLVERTGQKRNRRFLYRDDINLFHDGTTDSKPT